MPISASTFYEWSARRPTRRLLREADVIEMLRTERACPFEAALGARKLWLHLRRKGHDVARCTVSG